MVFWKYLGERNIFYQGPLRFFINSIKMRVDMFCIEEIKRMRFFIIYIILFLCILFSMCKSNINGYMLENNNGLNQEIIDSLITINPYHGINGAAGYVAEHHIHPVIILRSLNTNEYSIHVYTDVLPGNWIPKNINELELIALLSDQEERFLGQCDYFGGYKYKMYQYARDIEILDAKKGTVIRHGLLEGSWPKGCPDALAGEGDQESRGTQLKFNEVKEFLKGYIEK
jgi:hypothetical protein